VDDRSLSKASKGPITDGAVQPDGYDDDDDHDDRSNGPLDEDAGLARDNDEDEEDEGLEPGRSMSMEEVRMLVPTPASEHVLLGPETGMEGMGYV
jgi:hypothetical protein